MLYPLNVKEQPDIYSFQETHSTAEVTQSSAKSFGKTAKNVIYSHGTSQGRGVLLGFAENLGVNVVSSFSDTEGRYVGAHVKIKKEAFTVVALYLEPVMQATERNQVLDAVMKHIVTGGNS